jgi:Peptidase family S41/PDZ domain
MRKLLIAVVMVCFAPSCFAQLTHEQKIADFKALAGLYDKNYGPYPWKVETFGFDLLKLDPWIDQINQSNDDLSFYDICVRYVASLHDFHDEFTLPSIYEAFLPLTADIYDGKVLIDGIDRAVLDPKDFPFQIGDEIVSVDGTSVGEWIRRLGPYSVNGQGNPVSRHRLAIATMLDRFQGWYTFANKIQPGDNATLVIKNQTTGNSASFTIAWETIGIPLSAEGPVPNPSTSFRAKGSSQGAVQRSLRERTKAAVNPWRIWTGAPAKRAVPAAARYAEPGQRFRDFSHAQPSHVLAGGLVPFDSPFPIFNPPPGFVLRLGASPSDNFLSGTFPVGTGSATYTVGFIRIPSFAPASEADALTQFQGEITFFEHNTSGLVIDIMGNGGGDGCYANQIAQFLIPTAFNPLNLEIRATENWLISFETSLITAELTGASQDTINVLAGLVQSTQQALGENRGMTPPIPVLSPADCFGVGGTMYPPATDQSGNNLAYTKPILVLTDNFSASAAEFFGATLQDVNRITVYGERTSGGGGNVVAFGFNVGPYSEGSVRVTLSLGVRNHNITTPGLPSAPFIENIGVYPDIIADYRTKDNLLHGGATFVAGFSTIIQNLIKTGRP